MRLIHRLSCSSQTVGLTMTWTIFCLIFLERTRHVVGIVKLCEKYDDGKSLRCLKSMSGSNGDSYGRIGIINKSQSCPNVRFVKQEWIYDCGDSTGQNAQLQRVFPGEVLRYGDFMQDMILESIKLGKCGEMRLLECYCGKEPVKCGDYLFVATYKRGEHTDLIDCFNSNQFNYDLSEK